MGKDMILKPLSLLRLVMEKRARRREIIKMLQEEWNAISSFLDDFGEENWSDLDSLSKQRKVVEEEMTTLEKEVVGIVETLDLQYLEDLASREDPSETFPGKPTPATGAGHEPNPKPRSVNPAALDDHKQRVQR